MGTSLIRRALSESCPSTSSGTSISPCRLPEIHEAVTVSSWKLYVTAAVTLRVGGAADQDLAVAVCCNLLSFRSYENHEVRDFADLVYLPS